MIQLGAIKLCNSLYVQKFTRLVLQEGSFRTHVPLGLLNNASCPWESGS